MNKRKKKISRIITFRLFIAVLTAFIVSCVLTLLLLYNVAEYSAYALVERNIRDVSSDLVQETIEFFYDYSYIIDDYEQLGAEELSERFHEDGTRYTYVTDYEGRIVVSGAEEFIGRSVYEIPEVGEILDAIKESGGVAEGAKTTVSMTTNPIFTIDGQMEVYYIVFAFQDATGFVVVAIRTDAYDDAMLSQAQFVAGNRHIGIDGFNALVSLKEGKKILNSPNMDLFYTDIPNPELLDDYVAQKSVNSTDASDEEVYNNIAFGRQVFWDTDYYYAITSVKDLYYVYSFYPVDEAMESVAITLMFVILIEAVVFTVLFLTINILIKRKVVKQLDSVNASLDRIASGDLEGRVDVRDSYEFNALSDDINATVDRLKEYIAEAAARIDADLAVAKAIQISALPSVFPPFPEHKEFELFASMNAAKEVGGDFYDFYMLGENTLGFLIADVSGKSIPGAMFMMTAKTVIKSLAESGLSPAEVFTRANEKLCEGNEAEMFVTAWLGYLDLKTGLVRVANAGHNPPVLIRDGKAEFVVLKPGLMLAGMDGIRYKEQSLQLQKGDILYLYTDGVTEAMDKDEEQYGEDRLKKLLSYGENRPVPSGANGVAEPECAMVVADVAKFTAGAEQSDDITMLCIRYLGEA